MRRQSLESALQELVDLLKEARAVEARVAAAAAQYACVSANGYIEEYIKNSMLDYYRGRCDENALRIVRSSIVRHFNFKQERILAFFSEFRPDRSDRVKDCFRERVNLSDALGVVSQDVVQQVVEPFGWRLLGESIVRSGDVVPVEISGEIAISAVR